MLLWDYTHSPLGCDLEYSSTLFLPIMLRLYPDHSKIQLFVDGLAGSNLAQVQLTKQKVSNSIPHMAKPSNISKLHVPWLKPHVRWLLLIKQAVVGFFPVTTNNNLVDQHEYQNSFWIKSSTFLRAGPIKYGMSPCHQAVGLAAIPFTRSAAAGGEWLSCQHVDAMAQKRSGLMGVKRC